MGVGGYAKGMGVPPVSGLKVWHAYSLGYLLFFPSLAGRTELRMENPYVLLVDTKIVDFFVLFPRGLISDLSPFP